MNAEEKRLIDMIRSSKDPGKALQVDIGVIKEAIMELTMEERVELLAMWKDGAKT